MYRIWQHWSSGFVLISNFFKIGRGKRAQAEFSFNPLLSAGWGVEKIVMHAYAFTVDICTNVHIKNDGGIQTRPGDFLRVANRCTTCNSNIRKYCRNSCFLQIKNCFLQNKGRMLFVFTNVNALFYNVKVAKSGLKEGSSDSCFDISRIQM